MTAVPVGSIVVDIGSVPQWLIAGAAAVGLYKIWKAEGKVGLVLEKVEQVRHETNSMRGALELASKAEGRLEGRQEMRVETAAAKDAAKEAARADTIADAQTSAAVRAVDPTAPSVSPTPVAVVTVAGDTPTPKSTVENG